MINAIYLMRIQLHATLLKKQFALRKKEIKKLWVYRMSTNITDLPYNTPPDKDKEKPKMDLPARDIPRETINHVVDPQVAVNYLPQKEPDYIEQQPIQLPQISKMDKLMDEFRLPIILAVLYFIFQLPLFHSFLLLISFLSTSIDKLLKDSSPNWQIGKIMSKYFLI